METKICVNPNCERAGQALLLSEFNKNSGKKDGLNTACKLCSRARSLAHYYRDHEKSKNSYRERKRERVIENRQFMYDYYKQHPCVDCGEKDICCLDFDHLHNKEHHISRMVAEGYGLETILEEVSKCVVRCANCHRRKTAKDQNWYVDLDK